MTSHISSFAIACVRTRESEACLCPLKHEQKACREWGFDSRNTRLPTGFRKSIHLPFMFDKKLARDNSLVVVVHCYLQHLSPMSAAYVCTSDKRVEADCRLTTLER